MKTKLLSLLLSVSLLITSFAWAQELPSIPQNSTSRGPNCWNLALKTVGILPYFRFTASDEISFYSNSPLCHPVSKDSIQPGDIGLIRVPKHYKREEYHAFYFITPELIFSKNGSSQESPYVITSIEDIFKKYNVPPLPMDVRRCRSLESYLKTHPEISPSLLQALNEVTDYERDLEQWVYYGRNIGIERERAIIAITRRYLNTLAANSGRPSPFPPADVFVQGILRERLLSISEQIDILERQDLFPELQALLKKLM